MAVPCIVFAALSAWGVLAFALAAWVESRYAGVSPPLPRSALLAALGVAAFATTVRPLGDALAGGAACIALIAAAPADERTGYLFDALTLPACLAVLLLAVAFGSEARAAAGVMLLVGAFGGVVLLSRGRLMGLGDVKAMYAIGAAFGPLESLVAVVTACASGLFTLAILQRMSRGNQLHFGSHLAAGAVVALVAGDRIVRALTGL
jgi:prepilin signal peptidase PulO-like enzyme (type II secretory pathway)